MRMPEFIRANLEQILSDSEVFAETLLPAAAELDPTELRNCAEEMLQAIATDMETSQSSAQKSDKSKGLLIDPASSMEVSARRHAPDRWGQLFSLNQVVAEYRALRASVTRHWMKHVSNGGAVEIQEMTRFNEAIESLTISIEWYQAELNASEARYRTLFESIDEGFCIVEMLLDEQDRPIDYRFLETNPAFDRETGLNNAMGKRMRDLEPHHEEHWFQTYGRVAATRRPERFTQEAKHLGERWFDVYAFPVGEEEQQRRVGIIFRDVSEQKRMEEALRQSDRAKDEFLAMLGHELRNPLAPLQTGLDLLEQPSRGAHLLDRIVPMMRRQLSHLERLVDDLLDISHVSRGKIELQRHVIDVGAPAQAAVEQVRPLVSRRKHQLHVRLSEGDLPVHGEIADSQGHQRGDGLGVGLALSRQLVELHDGSIEVVSNGGGQGSEFVVRLPLVEADPEPSSRASTDTAPPGVALRILVVDDNTCRGEPADAPDGARSLRGNCS